MNLSPNKPPDLALVAGRDPDLSASRPTPPGRLRDIQYLADYLDLSTKTIRRMCDARRLPGVVRLGRSVRFDLDVIDAWVSQGCPPLHRFDKGKIGHA